MTLLNIINVLLFFAAVISLAFAKHKDKPSTSNVSDTKIVITSTETVEGITNPTPTSSASSRSDIPTKEDGTVDWSNIIFPPLVPLNGLEDSETISTSSGDQSTIT